MSRREKWRSDSKPHQPRGLDLLIYKPVDRDDLEIMSKAVEAWYRHYHTSMDDRNSRVVCRAAIDLFSDGETTVEALAMRLIGTVTAPNVVEGSPLGLRAIRCNPSR
jgi:hypothetical protein